MRCRLSLRLAIVAGSMAAIACVRRADPPKPIYPIRARFDCGDIVVPVVFEATFAVVTVPGRSLIVPQVIAASGARYAEAGVEFWNKGTEATLTIGDRVRMCREAR
jgi:membrane-bound inhibitor of C-type lysozyme